MRSRPPPAAGRRLICTIHGELYDLTEFADQHPGGRLPLLLADGADATELFETYHPDEASRAVLHRYRLNPNAPPPPPGPFARAVQARAAAYFREHGRNPKASRGQCLWYLLVTGLYLACLVAYWQGWWAAVPGLAVAGWFVFGMGHDGAHFAVSRRAWVNRLAALGLLPNMNVLVWYYHHTAGHHVHTNGSDDPDHFITYPFIRTSRDRPHRSWHRWQAALLPLYFLLPAGLMMLVGPVFWLPARRAVGVVPMRHPRHWRWGLLSWAVSVGALVVVPAVLLPWWKAVVFPLGYLMLSGLIFSLNVFASHLDAGCFRTGGDGADWARRQVEATRNWRAGSWLASRLSVGVNHQIEHHLFPRVNPQHYHHLAAVVRQTCLDFGVEYRSYLTLTGFVAASVRWVHALSQDERNPPPEVLP